MRSRSILVLAAAMAELLSISAAGGQTAGDRAAQTAIPAPVLHHIHLNSADPELQVRL